MLPANVESELGFDVFAGAVKKPRISLVAYAKTRGSSNSVLTPSV